ncbi:hypothetical protein D3C76_1483070 [compost metagenome]
MDSHPVRLFDHIDLLRAAGQTVTQLPLQLPDLVNLHAGPFWLHKNQIGVIAVGHLAAFHTLPAGIILPGCAEHCLGQSYCQLLLAGAGGAAEDVSMGQLPGTEAVDEHLLGPELSRYRIKRHIVSPSFPVGSKAEA